MIASSTFLGVIPSTLGSMDSVDWIPVDILANIIVELSGAGDTNTSRTVNGAGETPGHGTDRPDVVRASTIPVYHAVNPHPSKWADLSPTVQKHLGDSVALVSWWEWVDALTHSAPHDLSAAPLLRKNPGLKLLPFFHSLRRDADQGQRAPRLETKRSTRRSASLASLKPVGAEWMQIWLT